MQISSVYLFLFFFYAKVPEIKDFFAFSASIEEKIQVFVSFDLCVAHLEILSLFFLCRFENVFAFEFCIVLSAP